MPNQKFIVTGAAGWLGKRLVRLMSTDGLDHVDLRGRFRELRPQTRGIWLMTLTGILLSVVLTGIAKANIRETVDSAGTKPAEQTVFV